MKRSTRYVMACLALLIIAGVVAGFKSSYVSNAEMAAPARIEEKKPAQINEIHDYRGWTKVNSQPVPISSVFVAVLCRMPTADDRRHDSQGDSPHTEKRITVYVNNLGRQAMMTELKPKFPIGSVIVKEKLSKLVSGTNKEDEPELLTVMVKRESGFNPAVGDWEFMALNGAGTKIGARGKLESCQACHVSMKETDFISRDYLPEALRSKLR